MSKLRIKSILFILAAAFIMVSTLVYAQGPITEGSYKVTLKFPKASPTVILTFCPGDKNAPFKGAWFETDETNTLSGEMVKQKINGNKLTFTVTVMEPWDFVCTIEGKTIKGTVTGDGATSSFDGNQIEFPKGKEFCAK